MKPRKIVVSVLIAITLLVCGVGYQLLSFSPYHTFAFWSRQSMPAVTVPLNIEMGDFSLTFEYCCSAADVIIDDAFRAQYMTEVAPGVWDWKRDENDNILYRKEIRALTPVGTIIKSDRCYLVKANFSMIDQGIPSAENPVGWALVPLGKAYVEGWTYLKNHVVMTTDGQYFMAKWYTDTNPLVDRSAWNKIQPTVPNDFHPLPGTMLADYSNPKLERIHRSYIWDEFTNYLLDDVVSYAGNEYLCIHKNSEAIPPDNAWAWELI